MLKTYKKPAWYTYYWQVLQEQFSGSHLLIENLKTFTVTKYLMSLGTI